MDQLTQVNSSAPIAYTIKAAIAASGFSRSRLYEMIAAGEIEARKDGSKTLIMADSLRARVKALPIVQPKSA